MRTALISLCLFFSTIAGSLAMASPHFVGPTPEMEARWLHYTDALSRFQLQKGCVPKRIWANPKVPHQGAVMMVHGYTACPQQFFDWAELVAAQGWDVLLPLLPGHGRTPLSPDVPGGKYSDNAEGLLKKNEWRGFNEFGDEMNHIMEAAEGSKVIGGLSVGGTVAMYAIQAAPKLYDRALIMTPLLDFSNPDYRRDLWFVQAGLPDGSPLGWYRITWGDGCHEERSQGRAGICDFWASTAAAIQNFGLHVASIFKSGQTQVQVVTVEADPTAWNEPILKAYKNFSPSARDSICFMPKGVNHSLISKYDAPKSKKWWFSALYRETADFVMHGDLMPLGDRSQTDPGYFRCALPGVRE